MLVFYPGGLICWVAVGKAAADALELRGHAITLFFPLCALFYPSSASPCYSGVHDAGPMCKESSPFAYPIARRSMPCPHHTTPHHSQSPLFLLPATTPQQTIHRSIPYSAPIGLQGNLHDWFVARRCGHQGTPHPLEEPDLGHLLRGRRHLRRHHCHHPLGASTLKPLSERCWDAHSRHDHDRDEALCMGSHS
jgi:hypothetical protein